MVTMEFTQEDMWAMAGSAPSRSLEDDINETYERIYHRAVTAVQIRSYDKISRILDYALEPQVVSVGMQLQVQKGVDVEDWIKHEQEKARSLIEQMKGLLEYRKEQASHNNER